MILIGPAINTAKELHEFLSSKNLFCTNEKLGESQFFISVPNMENTNIKTENQKFTYEYKYGREVNEIQEYVKIVPFSRENISPEIYKSIEKKLPYSYDLIQKSFENK